MDVPLCKYGYSDAAAIYVPHAHAQTCRDLIETGIGRCTLWTRYQQENGLTRNTVFKKL